MVRILNNPGNLAFCGMVLFLICHTSCRNQTNFERKIHGEQAYKKHIESNVTLKIKPISAADTDLISFSSEGWWGFGRIKERQGNDFGYQGIAFQVFPSFIIAVSSNLSDSAEIVHINDYSLKVIGSKEIVTGDFEFFAVTPRAADPHTFIHAFIDRNKTKIWPIDFGVSFAEYLDEETSESLMKYRKSLSTLRPGERIEFFVSQFYEPDFETGRNHQWFYDSGKEQILYARLQADINVNSVKLMIESKEVIMLIDFFAEHTPYRETANYYELGLMSQISVLSEQRLTELLNSLQ